MPTKKPKPLTIEQIEQLTEALLDQCGHEIEVINPLLLLMDDLAQNSFDNSQVESLVNTVKTRCYAATADSDTQEEAYIARVREQLAKTLRNGGAQ